VTAVAPVSEQLDYAEVRRRVQETIELLVPEGAIFAAVSKGDDALIRVDGRQGWHFPRTQTGQYAGHHPYDAAAAIAHLEDVRAGGAQYFVLPSIYLWWLDYYEGFARHLESNYRLVADDRDACLVYSLISTLGAASDEDPNPRAQQMREFLRALLPENAAFALVASEGDEELLVGQRMTRPLPTIRPGRRGGRVAAEHELAELTRSLPADVEYVVVSHRPRAPAEFDRDITGRTMREWRLVTRQENLAVVLVRPGIGRHRDG
jgi:hypothetical protein